METEGSLRFFKGKLPILILSQINPVHAPQPLPEDPP